jgi:Hypothetical protein (DUF2513)
MLALLGEPRAMTMDSQTAQVLNPIRRAPMKRNMELVRDILLSVQNRSTATDYSPVDISGYERPVIRRHVELLIEAGLLDGSPSGGGGEPGIKDLTWQGHDFVGALQDKGVWHTIKTKLSPEQLATVPLAALKKIATDLLTRTLETQLGLSA